MAIMSSTKSATDVRLFPPTGKRALSDTTAVDVLNSLSVNVDALSSDGTHLEPEDWPSHDADADIVDAYH